MVCSIHKCQGLSIQVILPYTQHYVMLTRTRLYTGPTRAKKLAIAIGL
ncbi:ATP-binding domain-containing protein [Tolypothrix bouteillei VB521301_2]